MPVTMHCAAGASDPIVLPSQAAAAVSGSASTRKSVARSATALLVKNLPYSVTEEELVALFSKQGSVARLVLPATRTLAVVEFDHAPDARKAFRTLAYKKFQHVPLYLEWAPQGVFVADAPKYDLEAVKARAANAAKTTKPGKAVDVATLAGVDDDSSLPLTSLFVKNLSFGTTDAALLKHFRKAAQEAGGSVRSARVARKKAKTGETLSKGFGFVDVGSEEVARKLLDRMQGSELDGHKLVLQLSRGGKVRGAGCSARASRRPGIVTQVFALHMHCMVCLPLRILHSLRLRVGLRRPSQRGRRRWRRA